jgi:hypothetical protein
MKKIDSIIGTCCFRSLQDAYNYYAYGFTHKEVDKKLSEGEIYIGKPKVEENQELAVIEGRYQITTYKKG